MTDLTNPWPSWGEQGELPPSGFFYERGDQVNEKHLDALWDTLDTEQQALITAITDRVSDISGNVILDSGLAVTQGSGTREVDVSASSDGAYVDGQQTGSTTATTLTHTTNGSGTTRTDSVWVNESGGVGKTEDTTSVSASRFKIAEVDIATNDTIDEIRNVGNRLTNLYRSDDVPDGLQAGDVFHNQTTNRSAVYQSGALRKLLTDEDSIDVVAGDGLSDGGSINLDGGSTSLSVNQGSGSGLDADSVDGEDASAFADTNHGNEEHNKTFTTLAEVNNNADVPNADYADSAGDADTVDGVEANELAPTGGIIMWSGSISNIPNGWTLCDGTGGTPDLTDKFVTGAGGQYNVGDTGGEDKHTLTESELPGHNHGGGDHSHGTNAAEKVNSSGASLDSDSDMVTESGPTATISSSGTIIETVGNDEAHENRPPYYALAYIMKL